jgi:hypothetical protein
MSQFKTCMVLTWLLSCWPILCQCGPSARTIALAIIDPSVFELVESGLHKPKFSGPAGSASIVKYSEWNNALDQVQLPDGAVKLVTPGNGKPATVLLTFSVMAKVRGIPKHSCGSIVY